MLDRAVGLQEASLHLSSTTVMIALSRFAAQEDTCVGGGGGGGVKAT